MKVCSFIITQNHRNARQPANANRRVLEVRALGFVLTINLIL